MKALMFAQLLLVSQPGSSGEILSVHIYPQLVEVRVASNGCTTKDSFQFRFIGAEQGRRRYSFERLARAVDYCKAWLPEGVTLFYVPSDIGVESFCDVQVVNFPNMNGERPVC
ncbi:MULTISPECIES: hypothetical protein [Mesorhizobium]|uniref:hypothetical protein n=1 Tax=Mesorhizobium TaxID=68287 RepID=UPI001140DDE4|nr:MULTISPECIES: hypothetical protein [Mesorhizobium]